ncbi:zinc-binding dehydrogenase [Streptomyces sp. NPDC102364]|uniref:zinc-dependent alcohol dehydrogenase n=1 Tax=Streptomyces sp. NPDC102364 TaxID=3366161 RepID=UPI003828B169
MRAIVKTGPTAGFEYRTDQEERASLAPGEVRVIVAAASVCGTDRELVNYTPAAEAFGLAFPVTLGHEVSGTVAEVGAAVRNVRVGDRVALESHIACETCYHCRLGQGHNCLNMKLLGLHLDGGFAEQTIVPEQACYVLPDSVPLEVGALFESAGVAVHAMLRSGHLLGGESVLIAGGGPIGLVLVQLAQAFGARQVVVVEPNPYRRTLAEKWGAKTIEPGPDAADWCRQDSADRGGFDVGFDCSGAPGALDTLLHALRREATAVCVGLPNQAYSLDITRHVIKQGLTLKGSFGRSLWATWDRLAALVASGRLDLSALISQRLSLAEFSDAVDLLSGDAAKVLLVPTVHGPFGT